MNIPDVLTRFGRLDAKQIALLAEAIAMLALARVWLGIAPFRQVARHLGTPGPASPPRSDSIGSVRTDTARAVRWAINRAASRVPFRAVCLQQAVAAKIMLARRGIPATVFFGMTPTCVAGTEPRAHAWVCAGPVKVSGYPLEDELVAVAQFE